MRTILAVFVGLCVMGLPCISSGAVGENISLLEHAGGFCSGVTVVGQYAYVVDFGGLSVLDVSTPRVPVLVGHLALPDAADHGGRVAVLNNRVYVPWSGNVFSKATTTGGFRVVDVTNPAAPRLLASYAAPGGVTGMAVRSNIAYVPWVIVNVNTYQYSGGLQILDVSDPASPVLMGECDSGASMGIVLDGNNAYIPRFTGLAIVDVTAPSAPTVLGEYTSSGVISIASDIALSNNVAFLVQFRTENLSSSIYSLETVDVSNPAVPVTLGSCTLATFPGIIVDNSSVMLSGTKAIIGNNEAGLQIVETANPASPQLLSTNLMPCEVMQVATSGTTAYLAGGLSGLEVVDMSDPVNPERLYSFLMGAPGRSVVSNGYAYTFWEHHFHKGSLWRNTGGLRIASIPDMTPVTDIDAPGKVLGIAVSSGRAYVAWIDDEASTAGIEIYDVANPAAHTKLGSYVPPNRFRSIAATGNILYVADADGKLMIVNLANPASPVSLVSSYLGDPPIDRLTVSGTVLCGWSQDGVNVVDVSNPQSPALLWQASGNYSDVKRQGNTSFFVNDQALTICDKTFGVSHRFDTISAESVAVTGRLAYLGTASSVKVLDIINPAAPVVLGSFDYADLSPKLCAAEGVVYASEDDRGMFGLKYSGPVSSNLSVDFDSQWTGLCSLDSLDPGEADVNGDGLPERWALRLLQVVLDTPDFPLHEAVCAAYIDNLMELDGETGSVVIQNRECLAALLTMSGSIRDHVTDRFSLAGTYHLIAQEPFSGLGDLDHDGITNAGEYAAVAGSGGTLDAFSQMALYLSGAGGVPAMGLLGVASLLGLIAFAGARKTIRNATSRQK